MIFCIFPQAGQLHLAWFIVGPTAGPSPVHRWSIAVPWSGPSPDGIPKKVILLIVITVLLSTIVVDYAKARDCNCKKRNGSLDTHLTRECTKCALNVHFCTL